MQIFLAVNDKRKFGSKFTHDILNVYVIIDVEQVCPPILATGVFVGVHPLRPLRTRTEFLEKRRVKSDDHRVYRRQSGMKMIGCQSTSKFAESMKNRQK